MRDRSRNTNNRHKDIPERHTDLADFPREFERWKVKISLNPHLSMMLFPPLFVFIHPQLIHFTPPLRLLIDFKTTK